MIHSFQNILQNLNNPPQPNGAIVVAQAPATDAATAGATAAPVAVGATSDVAAAPVAKNTVAANGRPKATAQLGIEAPAAVDAHPCAETTAQ